MIADSKWAMRTTVEPTAVRPPARDVPAGAVKDEAATMPTILIVDDEPIVREVVEQYLRQEGFAVEAAEGTDQMLVRVAELRRTGRLAAGEGRGVLVKCPKPTQDRRFDLPSIGPQTIKGVASAGLAGVAVAAGETIAAQSARLVEIADRENVFVAGLASGLQR